MGMLPSFDVHDLLDALNDSVGLRSGELVGSVAEAHRQEDKKHRH